jgi:hypothetical protein
VVQPSRLHAQAGRPRHNGPAQPTFIGWLLRLGVSPLAYGYAVTGRSVEMTTVVVEA